MGKKEEYAARRRKDSKWLCRCCLNWNDEIDFTLYQLMTNAERSIVVKQLKKRGAETFEISFGACQEQTYTGAEIRDALTWAKIPDARTLAFLRKMIDEDADPISGPIVGEQSDYQYSEEV